MDTSETYIKMCEKALGLQNEKWVSKKGKAYPWTEGDMISLKGNVFMYDSCSHSEGFIEPEVYNIECVWLPRQDQLQEMVGGFGAGFVDWSGWIDNIYPEQCNPFSKSWRFTSMEQLWLAFVMKEKYNKIWDGKGWNNPP